MFSGRYGKLWAALEAEIEVREDFADAIDHGITVSKLAGMLAKKAGCDAEFCTEMMRAGLIHDIGKLQINKYLYGRKQDSLKIEELKYIRMHPFLGYQELKKAGDFSDFVMEAVYHHHENFDGSGYPDNQKGLEIPYGSRILRICDVYAALISERPYRAAFDRDTAVELMIDEVKNYDMRLFLFFLEMVHSEEIKSVWSNVDETNKRIRERKRRQDNAEGISHPKNAGEGVTGDKASEGRRVEEERAKKNFGIEQERWVEVSVGHT